MKYPLIPIPNYIDDSEPDCSRVAAAELEAILRLPPIGCVDLILTTKCNMRCDYCFVEGKSNGTTMSAEMAKRVIEFIFDQARGRDAVEIVLFGGEPLLCWPLIRDIIVPFAEARAQRDQKRVRFNMTTNGTLLTEPVLQFLQSHGITFLLSLDGAASSHDRHRLMLNKTSSFNYLEQNIPLFKRYQPWMGARMTVHPDTVKDMHVNVELLYRLGINQVIIRPAFGPKWGDAELDEYDRQMLHVAEFYKDRMAEKSFFRMTLFEHDVEAISGNLKNLPRQ